MADVRSTAKPPASVKITVPALLVAADAVHVPVTAALAVAPEPTIITSATLPTPRSVIVSTPDPILKVSIPAPPVRLSLPEPPIRVSAPSPPIITSAPLPPLKRLAPLEPVKLTAAAEAEASTFSKPVTVTLPEPVSWSSVTDRSIVAAWLRIKVSLSVPAAPVTESPIITVPVVSFS